MLGSRGLIFLLYYLMKKKYFITIEGIEGAGKSTAMNTIRQWLISAQIPHIFTREPGGTEIAEEIRRVLLAHHQEEMFEDTELLLMFAGRAQHLAKVIKPALENGYTVICDRFTDASYAYQGGGRGIPHARIAAIESWVQGDLRPHLTILMDVSVDVGLQRIKKRSLQDRIEREQMEFFQRVHDTYLQRAKQNPKQYKIINANQSLEEVEKQLHQLLADIFQISPEKSPQ
jgi:dTMP kinase